jgi:threonine dehydrogenase-like Zn-dependent dehydrogenase
VLPASASDAVKRLVGETVKVVQTEEWHAPGDSGTRTADLVIEIMGQPATMKGSIELRSSGTSVVQTITGDLKVSVPFFGKKIEPEIADAILAAIAVEQRVATYRLLR